MAILCIEGLNKRTGDVQRYEDVSLECSSGQVVALIGPSGGGKSSLLRGIAGIELPDSGRLVLDGKVLFDARAASDASAAFERVYADITLVLQDFPLNPHLSVYDNIYLPGRRMGRGPCLELVSEVLDLKPLFGRHPARLSVGQRQRVALARAFELRPSFLLLDEPTSAQDISSTYTIVELLRRFIGGGGAVILASHLLGLVDLLANDVLFMSKSRCVEIGPTKLLLHAPPNSELQEFLTFWKVP